MRTVDDSADRAPRYRRGTRVVLDFGPRSNFTGIRGRIVDIRGHSYLVELDSPVYDVKRVLCLLDEISREQ
jgi:ribosomal protein L21E